MHLLVLSAFQPCCAGFMRLLGPEILPQCTFWCSVLSDHPRPTKQQAGAPPPVSMHLLVLSAFRLHLRLPLVPSRLRLNAPSGAQCFPTNLIQRITGRLLICLNAPSGAQCFPTRTSKGSIPGFSPQCTFWCSVLSDRLVMPTKYNLVVPSQCTFWCSALSDYQGHEFARREDASQCTFWCSVLSDRNETRGVRKLDPVSMHLLVLSAFRLVSNHQRFAEVTVSMHLLVLSAFRLSSRLTAGTSRVASQCTFWCSVLSDLAKKSRGSVRSVSQCTFWCSVLSDPRIELDLNGPYGSQCTFWCSVLSDKYFLDSYVEDMMVSMHLLVLSAFRLSALVQDAVEYLSQCTFWCSVLSDEKNFPFVLDYIGLNAPSGAQCFPT